MDLIDMLDLLMALGAVANVAQFIEFAIKICSSSRSIYHSASGSLVEHDDLSKVTSDISELSGKLRDSLSAAAATASLRTDE
jgi:archaellum biogenesis ATPase FlaH